MTPRKPSLTIFVQNKTGGVQSYYANLVRGGAFSGFDVRYLVLDDQADRDAKLTASLDGAPMGRFSYGGPENLYHADRRLARMLPVASDLVLTNWDYELGFLDRHRPGWTVVHVCHDECYVDIALRYAHVIDTFVAHNPHFVERLKAQLPASRVNDVHFLPFGIRQNPMAVRTPNTDAVLRVVFIGRLHESKGVLKLPAVDDQLRARGVRVKWSILGRGPEQESLEGMTSDRDNFTIASPSDDLGMMRQAAEGDVFVLPSYLDGTPLALMEAMSVGLVPVISEFNPGAHWMAPPETGFICPVEPEAIARILARLDANRSELQRRSQATHAHARREFDIDKKAREYVDFFSDWRELKRPSFGPPRHYGSRLDQPWLPNALVVGLRRMQRWVGQ